MCAFGSLAYRHVLVQTRPKLDPRAIKCGLIGYDANSGSRVYRVFDEESRQVFMTRDVVFDEAPIQDTGLERSAATAQQEAGETYMEDVQRSTPAADNSPSHRDMRISCEQSDKPEHENRSAGSLLPPIDPSECGSRSDNVVELGTIVVRPPSPHRRTQVEHEGLQDAEPDISQPPQGTQQRQPMFYPSGKDAFMALNQDSLTLQEDVKAEDGKAWRWAWENEWESLLKNKTWVISKVPCD